jgi:hypothetical protein
MGPKKPLEKTKHLMAAMLGMKPKHHGDMKLGKKKRSKSKKAKASK